MSRYATPRAKHGGRKLAIAEKCACGPCATYRAEHRAREAARSQARRATRKPRAIPVVDLGDPALADYVVLDRIRHGEDVTVTHRDDRAAVIAGVADGTIPRTVCLTVLRCSSTTLDAALGQLTTREPVA